MLGRRAGGGYEGELDVVAFNPAKKHLLHIEASMDADSWENRETNYARNFKLGSTYIPTLFDGFDLPSEVDQIALIGFGGAPNRPTIGGGRLLMVGNLMNEIRDKLIHMSIAKAACRSNS